MTDNNLIFKSPTLLGANGFPLMQEFVAPSADGHDSPELALDFLARWFGDVEGAGEFYFLLSVSGEDSSRIFQAKNVLDSRNCLEESLPLKGNSSTAVYFSTYMASAECVANDEDSAFDKSKIAAQTGIVIRIHFVPTGDKSRSVQDCLPVCPDVNSALAALEKFIGETNFVPAYVAFDGFTVYVYWQFRKILELNSDEERTAAKMRNRKIEDFFAKRFGYQVRSYADLNYICVLPYCYYFPEHTYSRVIWQSCCKTQYSPAEIDTLLSTGALPIEGVSKQDASAEIDLPAQIEGDVEKSCDAEISTQQTSPSVDKSPAQVEGDKDVENDALTENIPPAQIENDDDSEVSLPPLMEEGSAKESAETFDDSPSTSGNGDGTENSVQETQSQDADIFEDDDDAIDVLKVVENSKYLQDNATFKLGEALKEKIKRTLRNSKDPTADIELLKFEVIVCTIQERLLGTARYYNLKIQVDKYLKFNDILSQAGIELKGVTSIFHSSDEEGAKFDIWFSTDESNVSKLYKFIEEFADECFFSANPSLPEAKLYAAKKAVKQFEQCHEERREKALELLQGVEKFDASTILSDEIIEACTYVEFDDPLFFVAFKNKITAYGKKNPDEKVLLGDWKNAIAQKRQALSNERAELKGRCDAAQHEVDEAEFAQKTGIKFPYVKSYAIGSKGVCRVIPPQHESEDFKFIPITRSPLIIAEKVISLQGLTEKFVLQAWDLNGQTKKTPPVPASTIFNTRSIVNLADYGMPVASTNAASVCDFLDACKHTFEEKGDSWIVRYTVNRAGWHEIDGKSYLIDPRRDNQLKRGKQYFPLSVETTSQFAEALKTKGSFDEWKKAYRLARQYPIARLTIAAACAAPLLRILGERNFMLYLRGRTRAGKTTALQLAGSAIGSDKVIKSFDATKNSLAAAAVDVCDYPFLLDEKQSADKYMTQQMENLVHALTDGIERRRLNRNAEQKPVATWRTIVIGTGETNLRDDFSNGGSYTRALQVNIPKTVMPPDVCAEIRKIISANFGHVMPEVVGMLDASYFSDWQERYEICKDIVKKQAPDLIHDHCRFVALILLAGAIVDTVTEMPSEESTLNADLVKFCQEIIPLLPTAAEIDDTAREVAFVDGWIAENQNYFIRSENAFAAKFYGYIPNDKSSNHIYIIAEALKKACAEVGYNYSKLVDDLIAAEYIEPAPQPRRGCRSPSKTHRTRINGVRVECLFYHASFYTDILEKDNNKTDNIN